MTAAPVRVKKPQHVEAGRKGAAVRWTKYQPQPKPTCRGCGRASNTNGKPKSYDAATNTYLCPDCRYEKLSISCRVCGSSRRVTRERVAKYSTRRNKHFDPEALTTICRTCFLKRWHRRYKKVYCAEAHKDMLRRRMKHARVTMPSEHQEMAAAARRGVIDSAELRGFRILRRVARHLAENNSRFFICRR